MKKSEDLQNYIASLEHQLEESKRLLAVALNEEKLEEEVKFLNKLKELDPNLEMLISLLKVDSDLKAEKRFEQIKVSGELEIYLAGKLIHRDSAENLIKTF